MTEDTWCEVVRTAASVPRGVPHTNWSRARRAPRHFITAAAAALATKRRRVHPMAIGQMPPSFLERGKIIAPKNNGHIVATCLQKGPGWRIPQEHAEANFCQLPPTNELDHEGVAEEDHQVPQQNP